MKTVFPFEAFNPAENFTLKTIVEVEEITLHDMIYVYHLIREDSELILKACGTNVKGDPRFEVFFKTHLLGFVTVSGITKGFYADEKIVKAKVAAIKKEKYLPMQKLDIQLDAFYHQKMKKVS